MRDTIRKRKMSTPEEIVPTSRLREQLRKYSEQQRTAKRECKVDSLRLGLGEIQSVISELENLTVKDVEGLCVRIKRKKHASKEDMFRLSHAFVQSHENIIAFVNNTGSINVLVKELTGHDAESQIRACETLCNLSLGDNVPCEKIALNAGSYLVTYLDSTDIRLKTTSLWVISNIAATGGKGLQTLISLEIISKLFHLWSSEKDEEFLQDVVIALDLVVNSTCIRAEDKDNLRRNLLAKRPRAAFDEYHLKIIFESLIGPDVHLSENEILYLMNFCMYTVTHTNDISTNANILKILYSFRIFSNLILLYPNAAGVFVESAISAGACISEAINRLLGRGVGVEEILWFVKTLLMSQNADLQIYLQDNNFLGELKVGRFSVANRL